MGQQKGRLLLHALFILIALIILVDFLLPGSSISTEVTNIEVERQQYYNAASNYHFTYKVSTAGHQFSVPEDFAVLVKKHDKIEYSVSLIFREINWYKLLTTSKNKSSLRIMLGLILPLLYILSLLVAFKTKWKMDIMVFVIHILLVTDFIFLLT